MNRIALTFLAAISFVGCDAVSRTQIDVSPEGTDSADPGLEVIVDIVSKTAAEFDLSRSGHGKSEFSFVDSRPVGENPHLYMGIRKSFDPIRIEIIEMYISHPTDKHKQFAQSLVQDLNASGYSTDIVHQTPDAFNWQWIFLFVFLPFAGFLVWKYFRKVGHQ